MPTYQQDRRLMRLPASMRYTTKVKAIAPNNLIGLWPLAESGGAAIRDESGNGRNGVYTGVTLGAVGIGDGRTAATFGANAYGLLYSASLAAAFTGGELTMAIWARVTGASVWSDGVIRRFWVMSADASNRILLQKNSGANTLIPSYVAGGVTKNAGNLTFSSTAWFHVCVTASKTADQVKIYINGVQQGATLTGLGTFTGTVAPTLAVLGADEAVASPTAVWDGYLDCPGLWNAALSAGQVAQIAAL